MLFYSLRKIQNKAGRSAKRILAAFTAHATTRLPKNRFDPVFAYVGCDFSGESYMLNPHELINNAFRWKPIEIAEYIALASLRNYGLYRIDGNATLDLFHCPVDQDKISNNRLLRIVDGRVHFYYEEELKRRNRIWH